MSMTSVNIFNYLDYRIFLQDLYKALKLLSNGFSYRSFARDANLASASYLKLVMDGKRNLTEDSVEKFVTGLGLKNEEAEYFRVLVKFNQSHTASEKSRNYRLIQELRGEILGQTTSQFPEEQFWSRYFALFFDKVAEQGHTPETVELLERKISEVKHLLSGIQSAQGNVESQERSIQQ
jgi:uncharacterized protein (TIGR02147 family)